MVYIYASSSVFSNFDIDVQRNKDIHNVQRRKKLFLFIHLRNYFDTFINRLVCNGHYQSAVLRIIAKLKWPIVKMSTTVYSVTLYEDQQHEEELQGAGAKFLQHCPGHCSGANPEMK